MKRTQKGSTCKPIARTCKPSVARSYPASLEATQRRSKLWRRVGHMRALFVASASQLDGCRRRWRKQRQPLMQPSTCCVRRPGVATPRSSLSGGQSLAGQAVREARQPAQRWLLFLTTGSCNASLYDQDGLRAVAALAQEGHEQTWTGQEACPSPAESHQQRWLSF